MRVCPHRIGEQVDFTTSDNPNTIWPSTTWTQVEGTFALATSSSHPLTGTGSSGGAETISYTPAGSADAHTLTSSEIPSHIHEGLYWLTADNPAYNITLNDGTYGYHLSWNGQGGSTTSGGGANEKAIRVGSTGGGGSHSHGFTGTAATLDKMPPYVTVNRWRRTA